jgi:hypothetical protein
MSIQEYAEVNSVDVSESKIGHVDLYAQDIYCRNLNVLNPTPEAGLIFCGMIIPYYRFSDAQPISPVGYGICNGQTYPSTTYVGVNILSPDLRNNFLRGAFLTDQIYPVPQFTGSNTTTLSAVNIPQLSFDCCTSNDGFSLGANTVVAAIIAPRSPPLAPITPITIGGPTPTAFDNIPLSVSCVFLIKL